MLIWSHRHCEFRTAPTVMATMLATSPPATVPALPTRKMLKQRSSRLGPFLNLEVHPAILVKDDAECDCGTAASRADRSLEVCPTNNRRREF